MSKEKSAPHKSEPPSKKARSSSPSPSPSPADGAKKNPPPSYGSQEYWEQRYQKHHSNTVDGKDNDNDKGEGDEKKGDPFHAWYFTYQDLRPLILPLILGGREEARGLMTEGEQAGADSNDESDDDDDGAVEDENDDDSQGESSSSPNAPAVAIAGKDENGENNETSEGKDDNASETEEVEEVEDDNVSASASETEEVEEEDDDDDDDDGFEEVGDDDEDEDEEEVAAEREGLAKNGPISILEVGCGDVPLGADLALELERLEENTGCASQSIVKRILCVDYSETVVQAMRKQYLEAGNDTKPATDTDTATEKVNNNSNNNCKTGPLEFAVEDARRLNCPNESFELILEKGTLDAMLSNKGDGVANCVEIVTECARVLTRGGYLVIISHLNAHTPNGVSWLQEVVQTGLLAGGGNATWEIEVHGNDQVAEEEEEDSNKPVESPGPAVYIIKKSKQPSVTEGSEPESAAATTSSTDEVTVKFFAY
jgi:SAM-dependent methyltransferase